MWTWIKDGFEALINYSPMAFIIGIVIIVLSVVDAFLSKKSGKERVISVVVAILSVLLLFVQAKSSELANAESDMKLLSALQIQRDTLSAAFRDGTNQVIVATTQTAIQTQRSAKQQTKAITQQAADQTNAIEQQAANQTNAIKQQAADQFTQLQSVMLGSSLCPIVQAGWEKGERPNRISVSNQDPKKLNMYDIRVELTEYGPDQTSGHNEHWDKVLQHQPVIFPLLPAGRASLTPVMFLSKMTDIYVEYTVTTRTAICGGSFDLFDTGHNEWMFDRILEYTGGTTLTDNNQHLSPGLANSKPDPQ
jgi:hypothetical protein